MRFLPSITFCACWHESMPADPSASPTRDNHARADVPSTGLHPHVAAVFATASLTAQFLFPTLTTRIATSAAVHAALTTSALRPLAGSSVLAPTTSVSALTAAKPSTCAPRCSLTTSPFWSVWPAEGSEASGEKCATVLLTETDVGKAMPGRRGVRSGCADGEGEEGCVPLGTLIPLTGLL